MSTVSSFTPPPVGQRFLDWHGCQWTVRGASSIGAADFPFAIVEVEYRAGNGRAANFRTSSAELHRLASRGKLKRLA